LNLIRPFETRKNLRRNALRTTQIAVLALMFAFALRASAGDQREIVSRSPAVYPELAKRMKISGMVRIEATIDSEGKVIEAKALSGNRMLESAAEEAVKKWKFAPGTATSTTQVEVNFAAQ